MLRVPLHDVALQTPILRINSENPQPGFRFSAASFTRIRFG